MYRMQKILYQQFKNGKALYLPNMNILHSKIHSGHYFQNGAAIIDSLFLQKRASDPNQFTATADGVGVYRNS